MLGPLAVKATLGVGQQVEQRHPGAVIETAPLIKIKRISGVSE